MKNNNDRFKFNNGNPSPAKECAYAAVFVALLVGAQLVFAIIPGVEIVTLLFVTYSFCFGPTRGMISATVFSFIRQLIFGFYPVVLVLYLVYYNILTLIFGLLGKWIENPLKLLWLIIIVSCVCTVLFTVIDNSLTVLWYGYKGEVAKVYWKVSLTVMIPHVICVATSVGVLFYPLYRAFLRIR